MHKGEPIEARRTDPTRKIRAPRGSALACKTWLTEAPFRMIQNNLDPEVAEHPESLVVYGGIGRAARNWECFGAPTALFCYLDERMHPPQWMDAGIFLQSVMLLLRVEGLDSCPQIAWAEYHRTVAEIIKPPNGHVLACGMSIGYADPLEPRPPMPRAPLSEVVTFLDG